MRKGFRVEDAERVIRETHEAGIDAVINFMFGFPGETEEDFNKTKDFLSRNKAFISALNPSLAYTAIGVGTYLYDHAEEYGVDLTRGHLYWKSKNGDNTYEIRQQRYRDFCRHATSLGIRFAYPIAAALT